jgi:hypothetical protein
MIVGSIRGAVKILCAAEPSVNCFVAARFKVAWKALAGLRKNMKSHGRLALLVLRVRRILTVQVAIPMEPMSAARLGVETSEP